MTKLSWPIRALIWTFDLDDGRGNPSFSKGVILSLLAWFIWIMRGAKPSDIGPTIVTLVVVLIAGAMGRPIFRAFIEKGKL